jgi:MFS family permease
MDTDSLSAGGNRPRTRFDLWLAGICASRVFNGLVFMSYAAAIPVLQQEWRLSGARAGAIAGGFQLSYAVSLVICSNLADRVSPQSVYLWSLFAAGASSLAFAILAHDFYSGLLLYMLVGLSLGGTYTTGVMIIADQFVPKRRGLAVGSFIASTSCGYACSLALSGLALPWGGYRLSFLLTGSGPILGWLLAWITLRHTRVPAAGRSRTGRFVREVLGNRRARLLIWGYTFHNWELQGMWSWTPAFLTACLLAGGTGSTAAAGWGAQMAAIFHLLGLAASFSMGTVSDRLGRRPVMITLAGMSTACSFLFGWTIGLPLVLIMALGALYAFSSLGDSPVLSADLTESVKASYLGAALGLRSLLGFGAGALAPLAFGAILDWANPQNQAPYQTWGWSFSALGLGGLAAIWTMHRLGKERVSGAER